MYSHSQTHTYTAKKGEKNPKPKHIRLGSSKHFKTKTAPGLSMKTLCSSACMQTLFVERRRQGFQVILFHTRRLASVQTVTNIPYNDRRPSLSFPTQKKKVPKENKQKATPPHTHKHTTMAGSIQTVHLTYDLRPDAAARTP